MIRVTHVATGLDVGGAELALHRLLKASDGTTMSHSVVSLTDVGPVGERIRDLGVEVWALEMRDRGRVLSALPRLVRMLGELQPDVVQTWMYHADLLAGIAAKIARIDHVVWGLRMSDIAAGSEKWTTRVVVRSSALLSRAVPTRIVCCSDAVRRAHEELGYARDRMVVIPNGFELPDDDPWCQDSLRAELGIPDDVPVIGRIGRFHPMKDHATFAGAAAIVQRDHPGATFLLCGRDVTPANDRLVELFATANVGGSVHLLGRRDDMDRVYGTLDVLCSSSASGEGFPNVIGEAMSHGVPVVATDVGDSANIDGDTGTIVRPRNAQALGRALVAMLELGPDGRRRLGDAAIARVQEQFTMSRMTSEYESLYREILA